MKYIYFSFKKGWDYGKHKPAIYGFCVTDTKARHTDVCGLNPFLAFSTWLWYLGVNPKYAFWWIRLKKKKNKKSLS